MIKKVFFLLLGLFVSYLAYCDTLNVQSWLVSDPYIVQKPAFYDHKDVENNTLSLIDLLNFNHHCFKNIEPSVITNEYPIKWVEKDYTESKAILDKGEEICDQYRYLCTYIVNDKWSKIKFETTSSQMYRMWIDDTEVFAKSTIESNIKASGQQSKELKLDRGKHKVIVKTLSTANDTNVWNFCLTVTSLSNSKPSALSLSTNPSKNKHISDLLTGTKSYGIKLSHNGKYYSIVYKTIGKTGETVKSWTEIRESETNKIVYHFDSKTTSNIQWLPSSNRLSFLTKLDKSVDINLLDLNSLSINKLFSESDNFDYYSWAPNENFIIYGLTAKSKFVYKTTQQIYGMRDRLPNFKDRSFIYRYDIAGKRKTQLTYGSLSTYLNDISYDSRQIVFSSNNSDYQERPFTKQNMFLMNLETLTIDTLWSNKRWSVTAKFSPDNSQLLCIGGPSAFGKMGENIGKHKFPNNYDQQLYLFTINSQTVVPISKDFNPSVIEAFWSKKNSIYIYCVDKDSRSIYNYDLKAKEFTQITDPKYYVSEFDIDSEGKTLVYKANMVNNYSRSYFFSLDLKNERCIDSCEYNTYKNIILGNTKEWNFKTKQGNDIQGRVYLPVQFDETEKYPVIVYYYGGTSPVGRTFGGRYPFNLWAGHNYIVYVLQPSGATGYGQEFSASHVNNWGITVADEIIDATKSFLKEHSYADSDRVGCIGASYGGFMTMYLTTRTNIFRTAISHAGISSISSYWGEGYWGYAYSSEASAESYPWNSKELYVNQSPLFNAHKVNTPLLLITGDSDTNVPPGESFQFYTALKILGKEVALVTVKDADHHIIRFDNRIAWHNTIMAWWDRYLKNYPDWWFELYPQNNY